jgi:MinD-like ATPase involved in chromosome partitioning or flagellar assembly
MVIGVASMKGSPGVTTFALALACIWPGNHPAILAELDASGGDLAGYFRLQPDPGIASLATETRRDRNPEVLFKHTQTLPKGLMVIPAPVRPSQAHAAITALAATLPDVFTKLPRDMTVIADLGRLTGPSAELAACVDRLLVLVRPRLTDLAHLEGLAEAAPNAELILAGPGPYPPREVAGALGLTIRIHLRHDAAAQAFLEGRRRRTRLVRAARQVARSLASAELEPSR